MIPSIKKKFGQHFLRDQSVVDTMLEHVTIHPNSSIFEIGCGDGFLTQSILKTGAARLWVFEIDPEWATLVRKKFPDTRMEIFTEDILQVDFSRFEPHKPWILLANLPYQITFPLLHKLVEQRHLIEEGVIMVQEEVAQKVVQQKGRGYGYVSLYFQHYFTWQLLTKISPKVFVPPPNVFSRLLHFKPRTDAPVIPNEEAFWKFIKYCFKSPRRTLKNNLASTHYASCIHEHPFAQLRAQQMSMQDFLALWADIDAQRA